MAILLQEEGLYERSRIYATDINEAVLQRAKDGIFPLSSMQENTANYIAAGGKGTFSEYYTARYDYALFRPSLRENVVFAQHNLVTDASFNHFNVIFCRNVLIYFNNQLQDRVQARREWPTRVTQQIQLLIQNRVISRVLRSTGPLSLPLPFRLLRRWPFLRRFPARLVGLGYRPEHVRTPDIRGPVHAAHR